MTTPHAALVALVASWRSQARYSNQNTRIGYERCANELEAALAQPDATGESAGATCGAAPPLGGCELAAGHGGDHETVDGICWRNEHPDAYRQSARHPEPSAPERSTERCQYCSFDPTSLNDYCTKHRPEPSAPTPRPGDTILRRLIWLKHGCPQHVLYGDDGEMQCHQCGIDFLRGDPQDIHDALSERAWRRMSEAGARRPTREQGWQLGGTVMWDSGKMGTLEAIGPAVVAVSMRNDRDGDRRAVVRRLDITHYDPPAVAAGETDQEPQP